MSIHRSVLSSCSKLQISIYFEHFFLTHQLNFVLGVQKKTLIERALFSTQNICKTDG